MHNMSKYVHILSNCKYVYENLLFNNNLTYHTWSKILGSKVANNVYVHTQQKPNS